MRSTLQLDKVHEDPPHGPSLWIKKGWSLRDALEKRRYLAQLGLMQNWSETISLFLWAGFQKGITTESLQRVQKRYFSIHMAGLIVGGRLKGIIGASPFLDWFHVFLFIFLGYSRAKMRQSGFFPFLLVSYFLYVLQFWFLKHPFFNFSQKGEFFHFQACFSKFPFSFFYFQILFF